MSNEHRVFLIGGSSHAGKSTLAQSLASRLGWHYQSTDKLARHPGRPWQEKPRAVPEHVANHYLSLPADALIADVLRHYRDNVWPLITDIVGSHTTDEPADKLVLEGSALLPALVATLDMNNVAAIWLTASNERFKQRIYAESRYTTKSPRARTMIDKFLVRTRLYNAQMMAAVNRLGLVSIDVEKASSIDELASVCLSALRDQQQFSFWSK